MVDPSLNDVIQWQTSRRQVYRYLYDSARPVEAREIAEFLAFDLSLVGDCLTGLVEEGMVFCTGGQSYVLEPQARVAVGVSILDNCVKLLAIDMRAGELGSRRLPVPFSHEPEYYEALVQCLEEFIDECGLDRDRLLGVGVSLPGIIDQAEGRLVLSPTLNLQDVPLEEIYRYFSHYPTFIENTPNASGYAERWADGARTNIIYLSLDRGVGGAIMVGDGQYMGDNGRSGEFGHMRLVPNGRQCSCGRRGCVEAHCSASRLSDDLGLTLEEFFDRLRAGDETAAAVWEEYRGCLVDALVNLHVCFDCDIVIGGVLSSYLEERLPELRREAGEQTLFGGDGAFLSLDHFGSYSACAGSALRFVNDFLLTF